MSENCSFRIKHKAKTLFSSVGDRTVELYNWQLSHENTDEVHCKA